MFSLTPKPGFALGCPCGLSIPWIFPGYSRDPQGRFLQLLPNPNSQNCPRARPAGDSDSCVPSGPSGIPPALLSHEPRLFQVQTGGDLGKNSQDSGQSLTWRSNFGAPSFPTFPPFISPPFSPFPAPSSCSAPRIPKPCIFNSLRTSSHFRSGERCQRLHGRAAPFPWMRIPEFPGWRWALAPRRKEKG